MVQQLSLFNYVGKTFKFKILKINKVRRSIIISRRNLLEFEKKIFKEKLLKRLKIGTLCYGYIKNITNYGIFVDINGIDGLLHFTDISWGRTSRKVKFHVGVKIKVLIIGIDVLKERISLGLKHLLKNP
ncbi:S1 RNA-binding domain-containing protein [Candidatus Pinguicoccus supinus]|uniref:S1 RNA-binding domain-containing protein n=1 Tax=Candidatus Pinguicoccus supinus TaxID=2529394 RepID=A0A7T0BRJ9_9BACT|nr:S1 RNA-binding domain-containing protein [Candidatus Pinguicoccus supinus]